jgi:hypothetical protein
MVFIGFDGFYLKSLKGQICPWEVCLSDELYLGLQKPQN